MKKTPTILQNFAFLLRFKSTLLYMLFVVFVNVAFSYTPLIAVFGEQISPVDFIVGLVFVFRDFAQREVGHRVIIFMIIAGLISYWLAEPTVALASICAFAVAECVDWILFTFTKRPLYKRLLLSSVISSPIDSAVFLLVINRPSFLEFLIITSMKILSVLVLCKTWEIRNRKNAILANA